MLADILVKDPHAQAREARNALQKIHIFMHMNTHALMCNVQPFMNVRAHARRVHTDVYAHARIHNAHEYSHLRARVHA
jgi:hypothetical protein